MIEFLSENGFQLSDKEDIKSWLFAIIITENKQVESLEYVFCDDEFLLEINKKFLKHDTYTDIISFDYSEGNILQGEIYISTERVMENATKYGSSFGEELRRVIVHGVLHLCGYNDKTEEEAKIMRAKEDEKLRLFHVEQ